MTGAEGPADCCDHSMCCTRISSHTEHTSLLLKLLLQVSITNHCVTKWIFYASFIVELDELMQQYQHALEALPTSPQEPSIRV